MTQVALDRCDTCYEVNPVLRPATEYGAPATVAAKLAVSYLVIRHANKQRALRNPYWRLLPQLSITTNSALIAWNWTLAY